MIDRSHPLPITRQAIALGISRGSVYYLPRPVSDADLALMRRIDELHLEHPFAGARMLRDLLRQEGTTVDRKTSGRATADVSGDQLAAGSGHQPVGKVDSCKSAIPSRRTGHARCDRPCQGAISLTTAGPPATGSGWAQGLSRSGTDSQQHQW